MIAITRQGDTDEYGVISFVADFIDDIETLPIDVRPGSSCLVIEDSSVYMLNTQKEWCKL